MLLRKNDNNRQADLIKNARSDYAVSAGLMEHGYLYLSSFLNTHVAQFVRVDLGQEQVRTCQDDEQNYNCAC
jgi:hypothetical protein